MESQKIPPQPPGTARAPCPLPERSGISSDNADPQQNSMVCVRKALKFHTFITYIYMNFFFKWPQVTEGMRKLTTSNIYFKSIM